MGSCPLCGNQTSPALLAQAEDLLPPLRRMIKAEHPDWSPAQGICPACALRHLRRYAQTRSAESLHTQVFPQTTFPYYHPEESFVLSLPERLPDYPIFSGRGVTIAFIDSGYYPHPDFIQGNRLSVDLTHSNAEVSRTRRLLEKQPLRIRHYLNLFEGKEFTGLDAPSLWSDAPNSWHGQMTSAVAAGNGLMSGGRYRGFAPQADILPIKVGRANGSIPEAEILRALQWLLREEAHEHYGVRVLNVSVGGDAPQHWWENEVCLAVEELTKRGVLVVTAAGNANRNELLAPAQAPSAVTVGGVDDQNRRWHTNVPEALAHLCLYHHNWDTVAVDEIQIPKPDLLALALWVPAPILPVSAIFREMWVLGQAWNALSAGDLETSRRILLEWRSLLGLEPAIGHADADMLCAALRLRMNPHKFTHAHYQHVDGTSVAAPQVAAVAAQMLQANPALSPYDLKALLLKSAQPLPHLPAEKAGAGLLMPCTAVAQALRAPGGALAGLPISGTPVPAERLRDLPKPSTVAGREGQVACYFGVFAPQARSVCLTGSLNDWQIGDLPLTAAQAGWWHGIFLLPQGTSLYRFWAVDAETDQPQWLPDAENPQRAESGFVHPHSVVTVVSER